MVERVPRDVGDAAPRRHASEGRALGCMPRAVDSAALAAAGSTSRGGRPAVSSRRRSACRPPRCSRIPERALDAARGRRGSRRHAAPDGRARAAQPDHRRARVLGARIRCCRPTRSTRGRRARQSSKRCWRGLPDRTAPYRFLDLGTGTGCLLLALLSEFPRACGLGIDIAPGAAATARHNAELLGLGEPRPFRGRAIGRRRSPARFDAIVANPPYIAAPRRSPS